MRLSIKGETLSAKAIKCGLELEGLPITDIAPDYIVEMGETVKDVVVIDSVDSELERKLINQIAKQADIAIYLQRPGGNQSEFRITINLPKFESPSKIIQIELAIINALVQSFKPNPKPNPPPEIVKPRPWYKFWI